MARVQDPHLKPSTSLANRCGRVAWGIVYLLLFRPTPRPMHAWRALLLRLFGAKLGPRCRIYAKAEIWAPWNLECEDAVIIGDSTVVYNASVIRLASHAVVSPGAYLCSATHDLDDPDWPMVSSPITVGRYAWVAARAMVHGGVTVGNGAVLGACGVATHDLAPWTVYAGNPARTVKPRPRHAGIHDGS